MLFMFIAVLYMTVAHMIIVWYLDKDEVSDKTKCCCNCDNYCAWCIKLQTKLSHNATQIVILGESIGTVFIYHIGTAAFYAIISSIGYPDICRGIIKFFHCIIPQTKDIHNKEECCQAVCGLIKQMESESEDDEKKDVTVGLELTLQTIHSEVRTEQDKIKKERSLRREKMYGYMKKEIFPLIEDRISKLAYEQVVTTIIEKK